MACAERIDAAEMERQVRAQLEEFRRRPEKDNHHQVIPVSMKLQPSMIQAIQSRALSDALFLPIHFTAPSESSSSPSMIVQAPERGHAVLQRHWGSVGALVWVVRRVQCSFCRHQAGILTALVRQCPEYFAAAADKNETQPRFRLFGIIKDASDEESIVEFQKYYFPFPLYVDPSMAFYQALGDRKLSLSQILTTKEAWKSILCSAYQSVFPSQPNKMTRRGSSSSSATSLEEKKVATSSGMVLGGLVLFHGTTGQPVAMFPEQPGPTLPLCDILQALQALMPPPVPPESATMRYEHMA